MTPTDPLAARAAVEAPSPPTVAAGWRGPRIIFAAFLSFLVSVGLVFSIFSVFVQSLAEAFGASMAVMGFMPVIYHVMSALVSPVLGRKIGRLSIRRLMLGGLTGLALGLVGVSQSSSLLQASLFFGALVVVGSIVMGGLAASTLITSWYVETRGRAIGLAATGTTAAGLVLPPLAAWLIGRFGWRTALAAMAVAAWLLVMPAFVRLVVDRPEDVGEEPEGGADPAEAATSDQAATPTSLILRNREFWLIAVIFGLVLAAGLVSVLFTVPYARQLGLPLQSAAWVLAVRSVASAAGQISLPSLSDRVGRRPVLWGVIAAEMLLWVMLVQARSIPIFVVAVVGMGFVGGALMPLRTAMLASVFGRRDYALAAGLLAPASMPFQVFAAPLVGRIYDKTGDYAVAFESFLIFFPIAAGLLYFVRDRPAVPTVAAGDVRVTEQSVNG